jgi:hypothetical protein
VRAVTVTLDEVLAELRAVRAELGELRARMRPRRLVEKRSSTASPELREAVRSKMSQPARKRRAA